MRRVARAYALLLIPILAIFPFFAGDYFVSLPLFMLYLLGFGPVLGIIHDPPSCTECDAIVRERRPTDRKAGALAS